MRYIPEFLVKHFGILYLLGLLRWVPSIVGCLSDFDVLGNLANCNFEVDNERYPSWMRRWC